MGEPVTYDDEGRLVAPRFAERETAVLDDAVVETERRMSATPAALRKWLDQFRKEITAWAEEQGAEADSALLVCAGVVSQDAWVIAEAMKRPMQWVGPRVGRLKQMELWGDEDGELYLGERFGAWMGEGEHPDMCVLLDVLEIEGLVVSRRQEDGGLVYKVTPLGRRAADHLVAVERRVLEEVR